MRVYEMSARFSRKVQVKQFEPAECEFEMKVELDETDDPREVREHIMQEVRDAVTQAFQGRSGKGAQVKVVQKTEPTDEGAQDQETAESESDSEQDETPKRRGRPPGRKNKSQSDESETEETLNLDPPEEDNVVSLNPNGTDTEEPEITLAQIKTLMNKLTGDGTLIPKVRSLLDQFGVSSTTELDEAKYPEFFKMLSGIKAEPLEL